MVIFVWEHIKYKPINFFKLNGSWTCDNVAQFKGTNNIKTKIKFLKMILFLFSKANFSSITSIYLSSCEYFFISIYLDIKVFQSAGEASVSPKRSINSDRLDARLEKNKLSNYNFHVILILTHQQRQILLKWQLTWRQSSLCMFCWIL